MYSIIIKSNTLNKTYNNINKLSKCYTLIIDTYRLFKAMNDKSFNIVLHSGDGIILRLTSNHCVTKETLAYNRLLDTWKAYA